MSEHSTPERTPGSEGYGADQITILKGLEAVRLRPGMYIGGVDKVGLHHLIWEVLDNAVDEAIHEHATQIKVALSRDRRQISIEDNGRGIPVEAHPRDEAGRSTLEVIFTELHAGGKFAEGAYKTAGGLHGVGASVVNALSESLLVQVKRDGYRYLQRFSRGMPLGSIERVGSSRGHGTKVEFSPDPEIFPEHTFDPQLVVDRLEIKSYLHRGLKLSWLDHSSGEKTQHFSHEGGLRDFVVDRSKRDRKRPVIDQIFATERTDEQGRLELALSWTEAPEYSLKTFVNGIPTPGGGTHEQGLRDALTKALRAYIELHDLTPKGVSLTPEDFREGIVGAVHVFISDPQFLGQTKERLNNGEVRGWLASVIRPALEHWLNANQTLAQAIVARAIQSARARLASRAAVQQVRRKSPVSRRLNLPGKLADCTSNDPSRCELFLVEGDSAGGSAKQGRDRQHQAILPLRGKVLNAEQASEKKVLANQELSDIVSALGCGLGARLKVEDLRYHKVILLMDADSDGYHISTLLLTFFYRYLRPLIEEGYVYLAQPPLYRVDIAKKTYWVADDDELEVLLSHQRGKAELQRFKGLGEMMAKTLFETTLDPKKRQLLRVEIADENRLLTEKTISELMGKDALPRFRFVSQEAAKAGVLDL
ncbi:MAG: DNA topoisomerase IV subunit B [Myxococcota bacterium]|nr:DNA topoisomerase IV subunit B [Myxococcota bacterium]